MQKTSKSKGYAFLNVPDHVYSQIIKLNREEFKGYVRYKTIISQIVSYEAQVNPFKHQVEKWPNIL